jgi:hypothetical protein
MKAEQFFLRQTFSMYLAVRAVRDAMLVLKSFLLIPSFIEMYWLTLLDGGIGDSITVTRVTVILEIARDGHTISLELRQGSVAKVQRQRLPASPTVVYDMASQVNLFVFMFIAVYTAKHMINLPPKRPTVSFSAPVGATIEFGAAEAPRARPRVRAIRDMAGMLAKPKGKESILKQLRSLLIAKLNGLYIYCQGSGQRPRKWNVAARPRLVSRNRAMRFASVKPGFLCRVDEYNKSLFDLPEKLSSSVAANEMPRRANVVMKAPLLPPMLWCALGRCNLHDSTRP